MIREVCCVSNGIERQQSVYTFGLEGGQVFRQRRLVEKASGKNGCLYYACILLSCTYIRIRILYLVLYASSVHAFKQ